MVIESKEIFADSINDSIIRTLVAFNELWRLAKQEKFSTISINEFVEHGQRLQNLLLDVNGFGLLSTHVKPKFHKIWKYSQQLILSYGRLKNGSTQRLESSHKQNSKVPYRFSRKYSFMTSFVKKQKLDFVVKLFHSKPASIVKEKDQDKLFIGDAHKVTIRELFESFPSIPISQQFLEQLLEFLLTLSRDYEFMQQERLFGQSVLLYKAAFPLSPTGECDMLPCYATPSISPWKHENRFDCVQVSDANGSKWYCKLMAIFMFHDSDGEGHPLAFVQQFDFVDEDQPVCPLFRRPWVALSNTFSLIGINSMDTMVHMKDDFSTGTCENRQCRYYVDAV